MRKAMSDLKEDYMGVGPIIQEFAGKTPGFNWVTKDGNLPKNVNGATSTQYDKSTHTVTTTFDTGKFSNATGISVAEVILHEAIHAYVVAKTLDKGTSDIPINEILGPDWPMGAYVDGGHKFMSENFRRKIASSLREYAALNNELTFSQQFLDDMAWGGLTTDQNGNEYQFFKDAITNSSNRKRIENTIHAEQYGTDKDGNYKPQKGNDAGC